MKLDAMFWICLIAAVGSIPAAIVSQEASCVLGVPVGIWGLITWWKSSTEVDENEEL